MAFLFKKILILTAVALLASTVSQVYAEPLRITLALDRESPPHPTMGDQLQFRSVITNSGEGPVEGLVAWISLVEIDPGREQPMDLEDWSAHKAVAGAHLAPGQSLETPWPMRLIQAGDYRVVISATDRDHRTVYTSPTVEFHVTPKPVINSARILPVALGIPLFLAGLLGYRRWRSRRP